MVFARRNGGENEKVFLTIMCLVFVVSFSAFAACKNGRDGNNSEKPPIGGSTDEPDEPDKAQIEIVSPSGTVIPYSAAIEAYIETGAGANVSKFDKKKEYSRPVAIEWKYDGENANGFKIEYSPASDYSEAVVCKTGAEDRSVNVYNLYKGTKYYLKISALSAE